MFTQGHLAYLKEIERLDKENNTIAIENTARLVSPHVYELINTHGHELKFLTLGCQGNAKETQKKVAELMKQIADQPESQRPDFILFLGDNFYDDGVNAFDDPIFKSHFYDIYSQIGLPCFVALGNHDHNFHRMGFGAKGPEVAERQVQHSYLPDTLYTTNDKVKLYSSDQLDLKKLPLWNMPSRYYAIRSGSTQIFILDTNTYAKDYLAFLQGETNPATNQAAWLALEMQKAQQAGLTIMFAQHHPLFTPGKRAFDSDDKYYLSEEEKERLVYALGINKNIEHVTYSELLLEIYKQQQFTIHTVFAAHDHSMYYYNDKQNESSLFSLAKNEGESNNNDPIVLLNNKNISNDSDDIELPSISKKPVKKKTSYPLCQFTVGSGGGTLQEQLSFKGNDNLGCYMREHGCVAVTTDQTIIQENPVIQFDMYTVSGKRLTFNNQSHIPIRKNEKPEVKKLRQMVIEACNEYLAFINRKQNTEGKFLSWKGNMSHGTEGIDRVNKVLAYFNENEAANLGISLNTLAKLIEGSGTKPHSLATIINNKLEALCGCRLDLLTVNPDFIYTGEELYEDMQFIFASGQKGKREYIDLGKNINRAFNELIKNASADTLFQGYLDLCMKHPESLLISNNYLKRVNNAFSFVTSSFTFIEKVTLQDKQKELLEKIKIMYCDIISLAFSDKEKIDIRKETEQSMKKRLNDRIANATTQELSEAKARLQIPVLNRIFSELVNDIKHAPAEKRQYSVYTK